MNKKEVLEYAITFLFILMFLVALFITVFSTVIAVIDFPQIAGSALAFLCLGTITVVIMLKSHKKMCDKEENEENEE